VGNEPHGPKWQAKDALNRINLNGPEHDVMHCLIDAANRVNGRCYPSEEFIAGWTNRNRWAVERAIKSLRQRGLIFVARRFATSNLYTVNWQPLFDAYRDQMAFIRESKAKAKHRAKMRERMPAKVWEQSPQKCGNNPRKSAGLT
jgi:hypothetical protein